MSWLTTMPIWATALLIFGLRVVDVSLGTLRTISVVEGRVGFSAVFGFFEVLIWITAVSEVITNIGSSPLLLVAYAGGFAAGNGVGILLERKLALGRCVVRIISPSWGPQIAARLREMGQTVTTFEGRGAQGTRTLVYATCERENVQKLVDVALSIDRHIFYVVERVARSSELRALRQQSPTNKLTLLAASKRR